MNGVPSSTYFTVPPDWEWLIVLYFFFGGLAGGSYFIAVLIDLFGRYEDRPLARLGYYISFPCVLISGLLLIVDLHRPERFWHMLIENNTLQPMFKSYSPMSLGSWALLIFGIFSFLSFLSALADAERLRWRAARRFRLPGTVGGIFSVIGGLFGFYVAGYTGVLLAVTNRPIWSDSPLLGLLFIVSAASISAALMILLADRSRWTMPGLFALHRMDAWVLALELLVLIAFLISLGAVFRAWLSVWGLVLLIGVVLLGMLVPLALSWRRDWLGELNLTTAAVLVLLGGFLLRVAIIFGGESV
ncbi:MAG TPA: NrfD/PsrC family molybdoenzyme membrane anchor subunit [Candidatus Eisenbacteria bacterium]|nr:NrfD/PsrC family molybdoenzyme membrane anchor subunit [Candidatus Eisenbacteria bacterium]